MKQLNDRAPIINDIDELINFYRTDKAILKRQPDFKNWQGDKLHKEILDDLFKKDNIEFQLKYQKACFVAGTLVHTDKGLVPIQDLKVGDMVLSRDEFDPTGELVYKPVLNTFKSAEKIPLFRVRYLNTKHLESEGNRGNSHLFCSGNHPFWVIDNKNPNGEWVAAEKANDTTMLDKEGNELLVNAVSIVPVRTLPNFPAGWGYIQNLVDYDDKPLWRDEEGYGICFVKFTDKDSS